MVIRIGTKVKVTGTSIHGVVTHIRHGDSQDPTRYKVFGKYWNSKSIKKYK
jgi:hypothetical protein